MVSMVAGLWTQFQMHKPIFRTLHSFYFLFFFFPLKTITSLKNLWYISQQPRSGKEKKPKSHISSETIILLSNVQIFANNCCCPAGLEECSISFFWLGFWQRASLKSVLHLHWSQIPPTPPHWCPGLGPAAALYPGSSTGAPGKNVKGISHHGLPHLLFLAWSLLCLLIITK